MERIYLDHAATTYVKDEVLEAMMPFFTNKFGNGSSIHSAGREARKAIEESRKSIAESIGALPEEIYFTSGGSESDNWAIKGVAFDNMDKGKHIITTQIEHHAVLDTCEYLKKFGFDVTFLPVDEDGLISIEDLKNAIREDTVLITIMYANNEIGTILPVEEAAKVAKEKGILFHSDAVQAVGQLKMDMSISDIDLLSMSGHKLYAPNGVGALYIRNGVELDNLIHGGAQERARRAGTENVASIVGLAKAIEIANRDREKEKERIVKLRDRLIDTILKDIKEVKLNGHKTKRLPNNINFSFKNVDGEAILISLDLMGICCSTGSACTSACTGPSYVLQALGLEYRWTNGSVRFSLGAKTTDEDIDKAIEALKKCIDRLRIITFKV
jgi:cysteine desulfurase